MGIPQSYRRTLALGGLRKKRKIRASYQPKTERVVSVEGIDVAPKDVEISDDKAFNLPVYLSINGLPLFPTSYEIIGSGVVVYHAPSAPALSIRAIRTYGILDERAKIMQYTITRDKLEALGPTGLRKRTPSQATVMGGSADDHAAQLIESGRLEIPNGERVSWHWIHLIAFSFLPTNRAQIKRNIICGTSAANGQMANIETSVKAWVYENNMPLQIEVTCSYLVDSHIGLRLRYRLYSPKTQGGHSEYYDCLSPQYSAFDDLDAVYDRMSEKLAGRNA